MLLYHASKVEVPWPEVRKSRYTKDFSWGFYCTNKKEQAIRWANRGNGTPVVNHCLSFEQVSDELIEAYAVAGGKFDTITGCKYRIPGFMDIGRLYLYLIQDLAEPGAEAETLMEVFKSFLSEEISNFRSGIYYENLSYLEESYKAGHLLE